MSFADHLIDFQGIGFFGLNLKKAGSGAPGTLLLPNFTTYDKY